MAALVEAQFRSQCHFLARGSKVGAAIAGLTSLVWYGLVALGAVAAGLYCSRASELRNLLGAGALFVVIYWQFIPLMLVSAGAGLDLRRLVVYPLSRAQLFVLDLILRVTSGVEALMVVAAVSVGLWMNPRFAWWTPLGFVPFVAFNLGLASALRGVFGRWMAGRRTREIAMLGLVAVATLPQILLTDASLDRLGAQNGWAGLRQFVTNSLHRGTIGRQLGPRRSNRKPLAVSLSLSASRWLLSVSCDKEFAS